MSTPPTLQSPVIVSTDRAGSPTKRLIVLVSQHGVDEPALARRIWTMALSGHSEVLYVALVRDADDEARARRGLALLVSMTRDDRLRVSGHMAFQAQWLAALRPLYQSGDAIVCLAEQTVKRFGRSALPLSEQLAAALGAPVCVLKDISEEHPPARRRAWSLVREAVPFAIAAGFLEFQMLAATQLARGAVGNAMLALSVVVEFSLIWLWVSQVQ